MNSDEVVFVGVGEGHVTGDMVLVKTLKATGYKVELSKK